MADIIKIKIIKKQKQKEREYSKTVAPNSNRVNNGHNDAIYQADKPRRRRDIQKGYGRVKHS